MVWHLKELWHHKKLLMLKTTFLMKSFIEDFVQNPCQAIAAARQITDTRSWYENIDEDMIYAQIASPEFRLYEDIILS